MTTDPCVVNRSLRLCACVGLAAAGIASTAAPVGAVDGVVLINQANALAGGVTPGDAAGFPVTLSAPGSYRLAGGLTVPNANTDAVAITADSVTLDLNGFSIAGPTVCSYSYPDVTCGGSEGTGTGIVAATSRVSVRNGRVRGMGSNAIDLGPLGRVEDVDVVSNGGAGIALGDAGLAERNWVSLNLGSGITAGEGARVSENRVVSNDGSGISVSAGGVVTGNSVSYSDQYGIAATSDATIVGNRSSWNGAACISLTSGGQIANNFAEGSNTDMIAVGDGVTVRHNVVYLQGGTVTEAGIEANTGNTIIGNAIQAGGNGYGIRFLGAGNAYGNNVVNTFGSSGATDVSGPGVELGENFCCTELYPTCEGSTICPWP